MFNKAISTAKSNPIGFVAGAGLTYWAMNKYTSNSKMWVTILGVIAGGYVGSFAQATMKAKKGATASNTAAIKK
jgi:outer membrane lipoprotein SlyB